MAISMHHIVYLPIASGGDRDSGKNRRLSCSAVTHASASCKVKSRRPIWGSVRLCLFRVLASSELPWSRAMSAMPAQTDETISISLVRRPDLNLNCSLLSVVILVLHHILTQIDKA